MVDDKVYFCTRCGKPASIYEETHQEHFEAWGRVFYEPVTSFFSNCCRADVYEGELSNDAKG